MGLNVFRGKGKKEERKSRRSSLGMKKMDADHSAQTSAYHVPEERGRGIALATWPNTAPQPGRLAADDPQRSEAATGTYQMLRVVSKNRTPKTGGDRT